MINPVLFFFLDNDDILVYCLKLTIISVVIRLSQTEPFLSIPEQLQTNVYSKVGVSLEDHYS